MDTPLNTFAKINNQLETMETLKPVNDTDSTSQENESANITV
jgi:hypothetical protein